jgi:hypothetical protein
LLEEVQVFMKAARAGFIWKAVSPVRHRINAYEVGLVPLSLRLAIRRDDILEKRSQNRGRASL